MQNITNLSNQCTIIMKRILIYLLFVIVLPIQSFSQEFTVMTYNIRYDAHWDTTNSWEKRKTAVFKIIEESTADIFGIQEALYHQIEDLQKAFPGFKYVGVGRDDGKTKGEYSAIFYRKDKFERIMDSTFWLSETPEKPSVGWDAALERICTFVVLEEKETRTKFRVLNTHFDHQGAEARRKSMCLLVNLINQKAWQDLPQVLMGDFNLEPQEKPIKLMRLNMTDTFDFSKKNYDSPGTFNGFQKEFPIKRIDYIFQKNLNVKDSFINEETMINGNFPSDHFPVIAKFEFTSL